jgi:hypothetical protein
MSFDPKEMLAAQRAKLLWCVHVLGPDDLHAMPSYEAAEKNVEELIAALFTERTAKLDVLCLPIVAHWPYGAKSHAEALAREEPIARERRVSPRAKEKSK